MKKTFEKIVLEQVEKVTRKNAGNIYPEDGPKCPFLLHQPKRPKK